MKLFGVCTFLLLLLSGSKVDAQGTTPNTCPLLGSKIETRFSQSSRERLFMNFGAPAQCNGTVTSWQYCYYNKFTDDECDDDDDGVSYRSVFLVYRKTGASTSSTYAPVLGTRKSVTITLRCPRDGGFRCREVALSPSEQFSVQQNDVIAACLPSVGSIRVVGEDSSGPSAGVYQYDASGFAQCSDSQLPIVYADPQNSAFTLNRGWFRLHLYAEINNQVQLNGGSNPPPSTPYTNSGTFINTNSPIMASNTITSWHYCYYPSAAADSQLTYTATVGVWRMNAAMNRYDLLPGSDFTLSLEQPKNTPAIIVCRTEALLSQDYVRVQIGDVVGVSLPEQNPLPVVASDTSGFGLQVINVPMAAPAALQAATLNNAPNMALHLFPTVEFVPGMVVGPVDPIPPTTAPEIVNPPTPITPQRPAPAGTTEDTWATWPTSEWPMTEWPTDDDGEALEENAGKPASRRGYYVAIGLGVLLVIVIVLIVVGIVVYKMKQRKSQKAAINFNEPMHEGFEASLSQHGLLTTSLQPNNCVPAYFSKDDNTHSQVFTSSVRSNASSRPVPYFTKDDHSYNNHEVFSSSVRSNASSRSVPYFTKDDHSYNNQEVLSSSLRSNVFSVPYFTKEPIISHEPYDLLMPHNSQSSLSSLMTSNEGYSKLGGSAEYSLLLEQVMEGKSIEGEENPYFSPANRENELYVQLRNQGIKMIRSRDIEITGVLGEGQFGSVSKGIWREETGYILEVAIKCLKPNSDERDKVKFLQEAAIMAQFRHPNVVTLYGVVSSRGTVMIVVELLPNGDLQQCLLGMKSDPELLMRSFTPRKLLGFCQQVALGMQYLSAKGFIHRDLAARNILISEGGICKIADFGMSIDLADENYYVSKGGRIPLKWTAPEALHYRKYSTASDVWSYGCLLYEIWSLGQKPFGATKNRKVIQQLDLGYRLPPPPGCPKAIYKIMIDCWHPNATDRPGFRTILLALLEREDYVLNIPNEVDKNTHAAVLGAQLEAAYNMYTELQTSYRDDYVIN